MTTINGVVYRNYDEAEQAQVEDKKIDLLKAKLLMTKSQKKRQAIFREFNESLESVNAEYRYELLAMKE